MVLITLRKAPGLGLIKPSHFIPDTKKLHPAEFSMGDVCALAKSMMSRNVLCRPESQITPRYTRFSTAFSATSVSENSVARTGTRMKAQMLYQHEFNSPQTYQTTCLNNKYFDHFLMCLKVAAKFSALLD